MKIKLKNLKLKAFRSFEKDASVDFPASGLLLLRGLVTGTGGSSRAGKSTILKAIAYALGYESTPAKALQSWFTEEPMQVELTLETDVGEVKISRGQKLSLTVNGEKNTGAVKVIEDKLSSILNLTPDMLSVLTYREQRTKGFFLQKTDSEKKEYLTKVLGLEKFELASEKASEALKLLENDKIAKLAVAERVLKNLETLQASIPVVPEDTTGPVAVELLALQAQIKELNQAIASLQAKKAEIAKNYQADTSVRDQANGFLQAINAQLVQAKDKHNANVKAFYNEKATLENSIRDLDRVQKEILVYENSRKSLEAKIVILKANKCPTCSQEWLQAAKEIDRLTVEVDSLNALILKNQQSLALKPELQAKLAQLQPPSDAETVQLQGQADGLKAIVAKEEAELANKSKLAVADVGAKINEIYTALNDCTSKANILDKTISKEKTLVSVAQKALADHTKKIQETEQEHSAKTSELKALEGKIGNLKDFILLVGREGFLGTIFDEILVEISQETNKILGYIPNTSNVSLHFTSESTTQRGSVKKSIIPIVTINGVKAPWQSGCSGGMQAVLEWAVDLAVIEVVSRRTGIVPNWLILDEALDGLGPVEKEACLVVLQEYGHNKLIIIVDHASEIKEAVSNVIDIRNTDGKSYLT